MPTKDTGLACYAVSDENSRGRVFSEPGPQFRSEHHRDRDRIIHSAAFRRLEYKTQVFVNHEGDMYRTRLTHSLEVAQIARSVAHALALNETLTEAIALAHDLGHTPFGHAGQKALNKCMKDHGGFEHNLQSLRIVDVLEERYAEFDGLNLTYESREGILKHCALKNARKLGDIGQRFIDNKQPSLEAQVANIADEIAYNNHDVDDGLRAGFITIDQLREVQLFNTQFEEVNRLYPQLQSRRAIHEVIRRMINIQITDLIIFSRQHIADAAPTSIEDVRALTKPLIQFSDDMKKQSQALKKFLRVNLYQHYQVHRMSSKAIATIDALYEVFTTDPDLLPGEVRARIAKSEGKDAECGALYQQTADYIAGMTDRYAIDEYRRVIGLGYLS